MNSTNHAARSAQRGIAVRIGPRRLARDCEVHGQAFGATSGLRRYAMLFGMEKWRYAQILVNHDDTIWWISPSGRHQLARGEAITHLDAAGLDGWELVGATDTINGARRVTRYTLKRNESSS